MWLKADEEGIFFFFLNILLNKIHNDVHWNYKATCESPHLFAFSWPVWAQTLEKEQWQKLEFRVAGLSLPWDGGVS